MTAPQTNSFDPAHVQALAAEVDIAGWLRPAQEAALAAYADLGDRLPPRCAKCKEKTSVHLMRRPPRDTDTQDHLTVVVTAPRELSDAADFDPSKWAESAVSDLFGP